MKFVNDTFYINAYISRYTDDKNVFNGLYDRYWHNWAIDISNLSTACSLVIVVYHHKYGVN